MEFAALSTATRTSWIGCVGGGLNFGGHRPPVRPKRTAWTHRVRTIAVEPASCPTLTKGQFRYDFGDLAKTTPLLPMHTLGHGFVPRCDSRRRPALPRHDRL